VSVVTTVGGAEPGSSPTSMGLSEISESESASTVVLGAGGGAGGGAVNPGGGAATASGSSISSSGKSASGSSVCGGAGMPAKPFGTGCLEADPDPGADMVRNAAAMSLGEAAGVEELPWTLADDSGRGLLGAPGSTRPRLDCGFGLVPPPLALDSAFCATAGDLVPTTASVLADAGAFPVLGDAPGCE